MFRLFSLIFSIAGATCAGIGVVVALTLGMDTLQPILVAAGLGALVSLPVSWIVAAKLLAAGA